MPLFDITSGIKAKYTSGATPQAAYEIMKKVVVTFAKRGYAVAWTEQKPPDRIVARLTDREGTDLRAEVNVVDEGTVTRCDVHIAGHVFLGGILGRLVSASTIQGRAQEKIKEMLDAEFASQPKKRAPLAKPAAPAPKPAAPAPAPAPKPAPPPVRGDQPWAQLVELALAGGDVDAGALVARAAAAAGALGDATLIQFVQIGLVQALAKARGTMLDKAGAAALLAKMGAAPAQQVELARGAKSGVAAAYALTAAVGEVLPGALDDVDGLVDLFGAAYEKAAGTVAHKLDGSAVADKLDQLQEAWAADLLSEAELLALRERVLATL